MTNPNERIHEAFRQYLNTTRLRRDGRSGTIAGAGAWRDRPKMTDALAALDVVIADYRAARLTSLDTRYLGQRYWRAVHQRVLDGVALGEWNYAHEYPDDDLACRQIGEWLVANRHLADDISVPVEPTVALTPGDPVWIRSLSMLGEYRGMSGTLATAIYRREGESYLTASVPPDDLMPMRGVAMTLIPDGPRSSYSLDYTLQSDPQEVTFLRWYNEARGLARDQAVYVTLANGVSSEFIPAWRLQPATRPAEAEMAPDRDIRAGAEAGWVFHRTTGDIVWAQGFSRNGLAFDAYPSREGAYGQRIGIGAARSEDYAWLLVGDPLIARDPSSYGLRLSNRTNWRVRSLNATVQPDGLRVAGDDPAGGVRNGYAAVAALGVDVGAALGKAGEAPVDTETGEHVRVIDGVEWVRKATVDSDMEALTRTLHAAADSNGLCGVYDRTVVQVDEATEFLKMGAARGRYRAVITETYTITREIDVPNEHRSEEQARRRAETAEALRVGAIPGATGLIRSAVTVDRLTRQS
jgi:hypothetical protein